VRPGLIVGPWEHVGRLPWWLLRMRDHDRVLCPAPPDRPIQWVDSRDLARFLLACARAGRTGLYNLVGPRTSMRSVLETCCAVAGDRAALCWTDEESLRAAGVAPWSELPLWIPTDVAGSAYDIDASRAVRAGARFRHANETIADVWAWMEGLGPARIADVLEARPWLTRAKEEQILTSHYEEREGHTTGQSSGSA
jgi:nucleoside-diphosphate-sugar epimerase